jgi:hypothetical protein
MLDVLNKVLLHLRKLTLAFSKYTGRIKGPIFWTSNGLLWRLFSQSHVIRGLCSEEVGIQIHIHARIDNLWDWGYLVLAVCQVPVVRRILCQYFRHWFGTWNSGDGCKSVRYNVQRFNLVGTLLYVDPWSIAPSG